MTSRKLRNAAYSAVCWRVVVEATKSVIFQSAMSAHIDGFTGILTTLAVDGVAKDGRKLTTLDMSVSVPKTTGTTLHTTSTLLRSGNRRWTQPTTGQIPRRFNHADRSTLSRNRLSFCTNQDALALWTRGLTHIRSLTTGQTTSTVSVGKITRGFCAFMWRRREFIRTGGLDDITDGSSRYAGPSS